GRRPAPRGARPAGGRATATGPAAAAKSKPMLGRRLAKIAVALTLLLGAGVVFYIVKDLGSPRVDPPPRPPDLDPTRPVPIPRPPTDLRQRITEFLDTYDG